MLMLVLGWVKREGVNTFVLMLVFGWVKREEGEYFCVNACIRVG